MFEQIHAKTAELNKQIAALRKEAADMVKPLLQEFVKANPEVKQIKWVQYTPYFNDGEPCVFSVREPSFYFEGDDLDESHYEHELPSNYDASYYADFRKKCSKPLFEKCRALSQELGQLEDALEDLFGDHVEVTVTADGVETSEYSHD